MSCCNPFSVYHDYIMPRSHYRITKQYDVPCGWCLNCRKDKQNYYIDRATYEYKTRITGSFVTFTYDDIHLVDRCAVRDANGDLIFDYDSRGNETLRASLNYRDLTAFIDNIRHYINNHPDIQNIMCQPDFSYMYVGEYGDSWNRCHFHVLFFGLDFAYCKKIIFESWKYGFIDVLPILEGGIRYVTKYMDKQVNGVLAELQYDFKGLARPKIRMSVGFGKKLFTDNLKDIVDHDFTYASYHGLRRPISQYWRSLYTGHRLSLDKTKTHRYKLQCIKRTANAMINHNLHHKCDVYDKNVQQKFKLAQALIKERKLEQFVLNSGQPVIPFDELYEPSFNNLKPVRKKLISQPVYIQRLVADCYRDSLYKESIPF